MFVTTRSLDHHGIVSDVRITRFHIKKTIGNSEILKNINGFLYKDGEVLYIMYQVKNKRSFICSKCNQMATCHKLDGMWLCHTCYVDKVSPMPGFH